MSDSDYNRQYLESNYRTYDDPKGLIHVFSHTNNGFRGYPAVLPIDITWNFLGVHWRLRGVITLPALNIDADFFLEPPYLPPFLLAHVKGPLKGEGVTVKFNVQHIARGHARFYERNQFLWVDLTVEELLGRIFNPPATGTIKLLEIPLQLGQPQYQSK